MQNTLSMSKIFPFFNMGDAGYTRSKPVDPLKNKLEETKLLARIAEQINAGVTLDEVLNNVFESFRSIIPCQHIGFSLLEDGEKVFCSRWVTHDTHQRSLTFGYSVQMERESLEQISKTGRPKVINDLGAYHRQNPGSLSTRKFLDEGVRSSLICPLVAMGKPVGFVFFLSSQHRVFRNSHVELFQKISGQLALIVEKSRLYQRLNELNKLKNKFLGIATHDLRSPITVIKGAIQLLLTGHLGEVSESQRKMFKMMDKGCVTMLDLINDLLDISAIEAGRLDLKAKEVDLAEFLKECFEFHLLLAQAKSMELKLEMDGGIACVVMDPKRIHQVISNLISNAIKFSYPQSVITLRAGVVGGAVEISVQDQGQGIPEKDIPKIFSEFGQASVRSTAGEKGTGLGLAIVKRIIEAHNGRIWVDSKVNAGSTFTFALPVNGKTTGKPASI